MSIISIAIIAVFILGYVFIALESVTKVNKAAVALLMFVACWTLFMVHPEAYLPATAGVSTAAQVNDVIERQLGSAATTLFFLMGSMTIVEMVDMNGGFNFVRHAIKTKSKRALLWRICFLTFFLSAVLDNMTTSIVMIMILRKLVPQRRDRLIYAALVILAANAGGAFSPIGDVTTIMLWNKGLITATGIIAGIFIPSVVSLVIPAFVFSLQLHGNIGEVKNAAPEVVESDFTTHQRQVIFVLGVGGLIFVPVFKTLTGLPPFVGVLLVLGVLWFVSEVFYRNLKVKDEGTSVTRRVSSVLGRIDMSTILFFLGVLMAVACLETIGALTMLGRGLQEMSGGDDYIVTGIIGMLSSVVDNVPLVAGCMGMYQLAEVGDMAVDGAFWQMLAYCAGVGGSLLIIGSTAGVVVMGLEKISFGWYAKHVSLFALIGYILGIFSYVVIRSVAG